MNFMNLILMPSSVPWGFPSHTAAQGSPQHVSSQRQGGQGGKGMRDMLHQKQVNDKVENILEVQSTLARVECNGRLVGPEVFFGLHVKKTHKHTKQTRDFARMPTVYRCFIGKLYASIHQLYSTLTQPREEGEEGVENSLWVMKLM